jgi:WD40 repeat protein
MCPKLVRSGLLGSFVPGIIGAMFTFLPTAPAGEKPAIRLTNPVEVEVAIRDIAVNDAALMADNESIVLVGSRGFGEDGLPQDDSPPAGAIVNLRTRAVREFTNGHKARIQSVAASSDGTRIVTGSTAADGRIRIWDVKAGKSLDPINASPLADEKVHYFHVAPFHHRPVVAVTLKDRIGLFDLTGREERVDLTADYLGRGSPDDPAVSSDDMYLACSTFPNLQIVIWDVGAKKVLFAAALLPVGLAAQDYSKAIFTVRGLCFVKSGEQLIALRSGGGPEVPKDTPEEKIPAEKRALFLIDVPKQKTTPLGIGHQIGTLHFALHPTDEWIATVGASRPDKPVPGNLPDPAVGELRVWHYPTRKLVHKIQFDFEGFRPTWVGFTPDGKKLVAADAKGKVMAWDFTPVKP